MVRAEPRGAGRHGRSVEGADIRYRRDIRHKVSPQHIKSEVSDYISHKTQSWVEALKQQAMENPMQAIAAGSAVAVPALRLARGSSLPLLMIGAGLALTSKTVRDRAAEVTAPAMDKARGMLDDAAERAQALRDDMKDGLSPRLPI